MPPAVILLARSCSRGGLNAVPPSDYGDMSTSVLRGIILLLGCVICVLSTYGAFAPFKLTNWVRSAWGKKPTFPFAVIVRLVMGSMLIFAAPESRFPVFFEVFGWFLSSRELSFSSQVGIGSVECSTGSRAFLLGQ